MERNNLNPNTSDNDVTNSRVENQNKFISNDDINKTPNIDVPDTSAEDQNKFIPDADVPDTSIEEQKMLKQKYAKCECSRDCPMTIQTTAWMNNSYKNNIKNIKIIH